MSTIAIKCDICKSEDRYVFYKKCYRCSNHFNICGYCDPAAGSDVTKPRWDDEENYINNEIGREPIYSVLCKTCQRDKKIERCLD